jgi:Zn-dependent peptidase ImmA (M78 family)
MPNIKPEILIWARETAGLTPEAAVKKLGITATKAASALERLASFEAGEAEVSRSLLLKMSQQYRRPLLAFYMSSPPRDSDRLEDFRNVPDRDPTSDALIGAIVRDVRARQTMIRELLIEDEVGEPLPFVSSMKIGDGVDAVVSSISEVLSIKVADFRAQPSPEQAFAYLRAKAEEAGLFVLLIGNLGSHHTAIDTDAFRGFALADKVAPFIVINDQDARTAWSFSLMHELAHVWLGASGVSGKLSDQKIEKFCNDVASAFLLPQHELASVQLGSSDMNDLVRAVGGFAKQRHLSGSMVAYSLLRAGLIDEKVWRSLSSIFLALWRKNRDAKKASKGDTTGPDYYVVRRHRLGHALLNIVARSIDEGSLTPTRAGQVLGVKPRNVAPLLSDAKITGGRAA